MSTEEGSPKMQEEWRFLESRGFRHTDFLIHARNGHEMTTEEQLAVEHLTVNCGWRYELIARS